VGKRRGNPNWGKAQPAVAESIAPTSFEEVVKKLRLCPAQYLDSQALKDWVRKNRDRKYVPLDLLEAWNLEAEGE
jgi:hypothetical protein